MLDPVVPERQQAVAEVHLAVPPGQGRIGVLGRDLPFLGLRIPGLHPFGNQMPQGVHPPVDVADADTGVIAEARQHVDLRLRGALGWAHVELEPAPVITAGGVVEAGEAGAGHRAALGVDGLEEGTEVLPEVLSEIHLD